MANLLVEFKGNGITKIGAKQYPFDCFIVPRNSISSTVPEVKNNAIYFLVDTTEGKKEPRHLYVGKTTTGMTRFFSHKAKKDWWNQVFIFTAEDKSFDEVVVSGLENLFITKCKNSNLYVMEQEGSRKKIDEDCESFGEKIAEIMDFLGYPVENMDNENISIDNGKQEKVDNTGLYSLFEEKVKEISENINVDPLKRYLAFRFDKKNLCAVWLRNYGLEVELYINRKDISNPPKEVYDITNRERGKKESAIQIKNEKDIEVAVGIIRQIINR